MSGTMVEFPANGTTAGGYLAIPDGGRGPGVVVLQEWWGLVPQIKGVCDRLASEGFVALAPDLYHGEMAEHTEMDRAGELMTSLPPDRAAREPRTASGPVPVPVTRTAPQTATAQRSGDPGAAVA